MPAVFGDMESPDYLEHLPLAHVRLVVSCVPRVASNLALQASLRELGYTGHLVLLAEHDHDREVLLAEGNCHVIVPHEDVAVEIVDPLLARLGEA